MRIKELIVKLTKTLESEGNVEIAIQYEGDIYDVLSSTYTKRFDPEIYESEDGSDLLTPLFVLNMSEEANETN